MFFIFIISFPRSRKRKPIQFNLRYYFKVGKNFLTAWFIQTADLRMPILFIVCLLTCLLAHGSCSSYFTATVNQTRARLDCSNYSSKIKWAALYIQDKSQLLIEVQVLAAWNRKTLDINIRNLVGNVQLTKLAS